MKSHHPIAFAGIVICLLSAVMLSSQLMATLQSQPAADSHSSLVSDTAFRPGEPAAGDTFAPELPPIILSPTLLPTLSPVSGETQSPQPQLESNNTTLPTRSFFRPQSFSPQQSRSGNATEVPPVGVTPPRFDNSVRNSFSGQNDRSFENQRGSFDRPNNISPDNVRPNNTSSDRDTNGSSEYYNRGQSDSFAPNLRDGSENSDSLSADGRSNSLYDDLDPELMRPESAYGSGETSSRSGVSPTDELGSGPTSLQRQSSTLNPPIGITQNAFPSTGGSINGGAFFPSLPGTAIGMGPVTGARIGLPLGVGHLGSCGCESCTVATGQTCRTCCQPLCVTKTILVPELYTVYRTVNETHYRPEIREIPYFREETLTHRVPVIEKFPVIVREPRIRNFKTNRKEEYQSPREVSYTVMVPTPKTRQVTSERVENYDVPEEEQYTVMVPKKKEVRKTRFKIVKDKEPIFKEYVVMVPQQRKRIMIDYETQKKEFIRKVPYTVMVERELERTIVRYRNEIEEVKTEEEYFEYVKQTGTRKAPRLKVRKSFIDGKEEFLEYREVDNAAVESITVQERRKDEVEQTYKVTVPYKEEIEEAYWENESYEEMVSRPSTEKTLKSRDVVKPYRVQIPYVEHVPQMYAINIPFEAKETKYRVVPQQIPVTKQQTVKRDMGRWVTQTVSLDTFEVGNDHCGCSTCCPKTRTIRKTRWVPNVVTQQLPYTTFKTLKKKVPYEVPVIKYRREPRQRMIAMTKFRTEVRESVEKVYSYETSTKPASFPVTKFRMVRKVRPKTVTVYREETRTKKVPINRYINTEETRRIPYSVKRVEPKVRDIKLPTLIEQPIEVDEEFTFTQAIPKKRIIVKKVTVRRPFEDVEKFTVKVPQIRYRDVAEVEEYDVEVPREVTYTVEVPEVRVRKEFIEIERKVPVVETSFITEMVPEIKTRRIYKSRERTVSDIRTETFMSAEPEVVTKTVFDTKYRDVPVFQSELYWQDVTKILKRTVFKDVTRKVKRPAIKKYKVNVPYLVQVRVPKQLTRLVPRQITIPIEACCEECCTEFTELNGVYNSYLQYGIRSVKSWVGGL